MGLVKLYLHSLLTAYFKPIYEFLEFDSTTCSRACLLEYPGLWEIGETQSIPNNYAHIFGCDETFLKWFQEFGGIYH